MSFNYKKIGAVAAKVLGNFGQEATFTRESSTYFDPALGKDQTTTTSFTANGIKETYSKTEIDGSLIRIGDIRFMMDSSSTKPLISDSCALNGVSYRVMAVDSLEPAEDSIAYILQLRR